MKINVIEEVPVKIRDAMVPSPGYVWVSCDYSQLEYRTIANLALDEGLIKSFQDGVDFHTATASMMLGIPVEQVDKKARKIGKCVTGDTLIYSPSHGIIRIDEISDFRGEDQFIPLEGFDVIDMEGKICNADSFYYGGVHEVTNIVLAGGYKVGGSKGKQKVIVKLADGSFGYKLISDICVGDLVPVAVVWDSKTYDCFVDKLTGNFCDKGFEKFTVTCSDGGYLCFLVLPVKEVFETREEVFDLYVPDGNQFIGNGFGLHNTMNFGTVYGMSVNGLAQRLGCSKEEAQQKQNQYFSNIPKIKELINKTKATTKARGYSRTFFGRMRPFKKQLENAAGNWYKEDSALKQSFNTTIQGTGADFAKIALARSYNALKPYGEKVRILTQVHDEINFEVKCVNDDGTIDSDFLAEVLKVIDYAMSFRKVYPGWADIPADIEIGWNYGSLMGPEEIKKEFGVDVLAIQASNPPTDLPKFLFENLNYDVINKTDLKAAEKSLGLNKKGSASKGSESSKSSDKSSGDKSTAEIDQGPSKGMEMAHRLEQKMRSGGKIEGRLDLSNAQFRTSTVLIYLKDGVNDSLAFDRLKDHVKNNFGTYDVVLEHQGILYRFHSDFRINNNVEDLKEFFDVQVFDVKPVVKLDLG